MSHTAKSPIKEYPGTITLPDEFGWDQLSMWGDFSELMQGNVYNNLRIQSEWLPKFCEAIDIPNLPSDISTKPPRPLAPYMRLIAWMQGELNAVLFGGEITPFSGDGSTSG